MKISVICFTDNGVEVAEKITKNLENCDFVRCFGEKKVNFKQWTGERFLDSDAIIFVSAMGICVRAIAPFIQNKTKDPAVIVVDDRAKHCISVLSGHLGGANELTLKISEILESQPIITTATDVNEVFSIDDFARKNNFVLENPQNIKKISAKLLKNERIYIKTDFKLRNLPKNVQISDENFDCYITYKTFENSDILVLRPKVLNVGIGCRKDSENVEKSFEKILKNAKISALNVKNIASIDVKQNECGILNLAKKLGVSPLFYSSDELNSLQGQFTQSNFVKNTVGTDNVCERSAKKTGGELILKKTALDGVTISVAIEALIIDLKNGE